MEVTANIEWKKTPEEKFINGCYSRVHKWSFDGGTTILASSSPDIVPIPMSDAALIDPEEAFLASVSSCHMLFFLSIANKKNYVVDRYYDQPSGKLKKNNDNKMAMQSIVLKPKVIFSGSKKPTDKIIIQMHELAHSNCFIANSIQTKITIIPL